MIAACLMILVACGGSTEAVEGLEEPVEAEAAVEVQAAEVPEAAPLPPGAPWPPVVVPEEPDRGEAFDWPFEYKGPTERSRERNAPSVREMNTDELLSAPVDEPG